MDAPNPTIKISFERDYYAVLELAPKTTDVAAIKKQYKKLSLRHHPDKGGDAENFKALNEAYQVLMDGAAKVKYDIAYDHIHARKQAPPAPQPQASKPPPKPQPKPPPARPFSSPPRPSAPPPPQPQQARPAKSSYFHGRLPDFSAAAAPRTFYLGQIYQQVAKDEVGDLLRKNGLTEFRFWWRDTTSKSNKHEGWAWVEFRLVEMGIRAWVVLDGHLFKGRSLKVSTITKPGALNPSEAQKRAVRGAASAGGPGPQAAQPPPTSEGRTRGGATPTRSHPASGSGAGVPQPTRPSAASGAGAPGSRPGQPSPASGPSGCGPRPPQSSPPQHDINKEPFRIVGDNYLEARERVFNHYAELRDKEKAQGISATGIMMTGSDGDVRFLPCAQPPPYSPQSDMNDIWVTVFKTGGDFEVLSKTIKFAEVAIAVLEGWELRLACGNARDPVTDKDRRPANLNRVEDTPDNVKPWNPWFPKTCFAKGLKHLETSGIEFTPGDLLGETPDGCQDVDNISFAAEFLPPSRTCQDLRGATSRGHIIMHSRPARVGAGWGQFDDFMEWQSHGRHLDQSMVEELNWGSERPTHFVSATNPEHITREIADIKLPERPENEQETKPMSLWRKFVARWCKSSDALSSMENELPHPMDSGR